MGEKMIRVGGHRIGEHGWEPESLSAPSGYDPGDHKVDEVLDHVGDDKELAGSVLAAEKAGKNRTTLVAGLEAVLAAEGESQEPEESED